MVLNWIELNGIDDHLCQLTCKINEGRDFNQDNHVVYIYEEMLKVCNFCCNSLHHIFLYGFISWALSTDRFSFVHPLCVCRVRSYLPCFHGNLWDLLGYPSGEGGAQGCSNKCQIQMFFGYPIWILSVFLIWDTSQHTRLEICNLDFWYRIPDSPACIVGEIMWGSSYLLAIRRTSAVDMWLGYRALLGKWFVLWTPSLKHSMAPAKLVVGRWNVFGMAYNFQRRPVSSRAGNEFHRIWIKKVIGNEGEGCGKWLFSRPRKLRIMV